MATLIHNPLQNYSKQLLLQFKKAKTAKNPALYLYTNNARTTVFMAESITRILISLSKNPVYESWHKTFKKLEDVLGEIDHYDVSIKQFSKNKLVKKPQIDYLIKKRDKVILKLNEKLIKKDFYTSLLNELLDDYQQELNFNNKQLISEIKKHINKQIQNAFEFFNQFPDSFNNMELQVHELRRKLRWVSIYAQSLQGIIVLKKTTTKYSWEKQFITSTEKTSSFNKLPITKSLNDYIYFNSKAFYALSNVINNLGKIKDKGLGLSQLEKSIKKTNAATIKNSHDIASKQLNLNVTDKELLQQAHQLLDLFFTKHKIHQLLVH